MDEIEFMDFIDDNLRGKFKFSERLNILREMQKPLIEQRRQIYHDINNIYNEDLKFRAQEIEFELFMKINIIMKYIDEIHKKLGIEWDQYEQKYVRVK